MTDISKAAAELSQETKEYIAKVFPCTPPCDSFGVCDNCSDAKLIRVGDRFGRKAGAKYALECTEVMGLKRALDNLPLNRFHNIKSYAVDGDPTCHAGCPACAANEALAAFDRLAKGE